MIKTGLEYWRRCHQQLEQKILVKKSYAPTGSSLSEKKNYFELSLNLDAITYPNQYTCFLHNLCLHKRWSFVWYI